MKNFIKYVLFLVITALFLSVPKVYAAESVSIESVTLYEKEDTVTELSEPSIEGLKIGFDLSFTNVNDYAKYKVIINNPTDEDYEISEETNFDISDYIEYKYEFDDDKNIVNKNSKLTMYIIITYKTAVPTDELTNGKYIENNNMSISLSNESISVPDTLLNTKMIPVVLIGMIACVAVFLILYKKTNKKIFLKVMLIGLIIIPVGTYALEKLQINLTTRIVIEDKYAVSYAYWTYLNEDEVDDYKTVLTENEYYNTNNPSLTYVISGLNYKKYYVEKLDAYYAPDVSVTMISQPVRNIWCEEDFTGNDEEGYVCDLAMMEENNEEEWFYLGSDSESLAFTNEEGNNIYLTMKFTMPSHDVVFVEFPPVG